MSDFIDTIILLQEIEKNLLQKLKVQYRARELEIQRVSDVSWIFETVEEIIYGMVYR